MGDIAVRKVGVTVMLEWDCPCGHKGLFVRTQAFRPNREHPVDDFMPVYSAHPQCPACGRMHDAYFAVQIIAQADTPGGEGSDETVQADS